MYNAQNLKTFIEQGDEWYNFYVPGNNEPERTLVIIATTHPNPLRQDRSIYSRKVTFDLVTKTVETYYNRAGVKTIVSGPEGLGAIGGDYFGTIIQWLIDHKDLLKLTPVLLSIAKQVFKKYKAHKAEKDLIALRSTKFQIHLNLSLYVKDIDCSGDIVPYLQQMIASSPSLVDELSDSVPYVEVYISYYVYDLLSNKRLEVRLENVRSRNLISNIIRKIGKQGTSADAFCVYIRKRFYGHTIVLEKVDVPVASTS